MRYPHLGWQRDGLDLGSTILAAAPGETYHGTEGDDRRHGTTGDDFLYGLGGDDRLVGDVGDDHLEGGDGDDELTGNKGSDTLLGGTGDDLVHAGLRDVADGGADSDQLTIHYTYFNASTTFVLNDDCTVTNNIGTFSNFESFNLLFRGHDNRVIVGDGADVIRSYGDGDHVEAGGGDDSVSIVGLYSGLDVDGGTGFDTLYLYLKGSFSDALFLQSIEDGSNHVVNFEHYDVSESFKTWYTLLTGESFTIHSYYPDDHININGLELSHGVDLTIREGDQGREIRFVDTIVIANGIGSLQFTGTAFDDRVSLGAIALVPTQTFDGGGGVDTLERDFTGKQTLSFEDGGFYGVNSFKNFEVLDVTAGAGSTITGGAYGDTLGINDAEKAASLLSGGNGDDLLLGGRGDDTLTGGHGADMVTGGGGADRFVVASVADLKSGGDVIADFSNADHDLIDLSVIDTSKAEGDQAFRFIGSDAFSGARGAWELRASASGDGVYLVEIDRNHDGSADFSFTVHAAQPLVAADFVL